MEIKALTPIKSQVLALDKETGVDSTFYFGVVDIVKKNMGADASVILTEHMDHDEECGCYFFPNKGDADKAWKRMVVAYKEDRKLNENLTGF
jgi:hypothetical protein